jgi:hypothetical protein
MPLFQRSDNRHNTLGKSASCLALSAETVLPPKHAGTDLSFTQVVGRFHAFDTHKCPQSRPSFEYAAASACGFAVVAGCALAKQFAHFALNRLHRFLEDGTTHSLIPYLVPPLKHQGGLSFAGALLQGGH